MKVKNKTESHRKEQGANPGFFGGSWHGMAPWPRQTSSGNWFWSEKALNSMAWSGNSSLWPLGPFALVIGIYRQDFASTAYTKKYQTKKWNIRNIIIYIYINNSAFWSGSNTNNSLSLSLNHRFPLELPGLTGCQNVCSGYCCKRFSSCVPLHVWSTKWWSTKRIKTLYFIKFFLKLIKTLQFLLAPGHFHKLSSVVTNFIFSFLFALLACTWCGKSLPASQLEQTWTSQRHETLRAVAWSR